MADNGLNGDPNAPMVAQIIGAVRAFIRDVGTPVTILVYFGLINSGYLKSSLTTVDARTKKIAAEVAAENSAIWALNSVYADMCYADEKKTPEQRAACYKVIPPPKCPGEGCDE